MKSQSISHQNILFLLNVKSCVYTMDEGLVRICVTISVFLLRHRSRTTKITVVPDPLHDGNHLHSMDPID